MTRGAASLAGSEALTADREESKFLVGRAALAGFVSAVRERLPLHHFTGAGANKLPHPEHFATTVYFDTPSHAQLVAANRDREHNVKIRAREYYDLHGSLAELATDPSQIVHYQPWVWFELKRRDGGRTQKHRFRLQKREVSAFFRGEHSAFVLPADALEPDLSAIVAYRRAIGEALVPSCLVNYRRVAFQDERGLRLTIDLDIGFYVPPADLWTRRHALVRGTFGAPVAVERRALVEVKRLGALPSWLSQALASAQAEATSYSKFQRAGQVIHGLG